MKIEKTKPKKGVTELPLVTKELIVRLQTCSDEQVVETLKTITVWRYGKCELYHWVDILDRFDAILKEAASCDDDPTLDGSINTDCIFLCSKMSNPQFKEKVLVVLNFTALLIEHSYARHIYNSTEHLCVLLACPDLDVVLSVLNLFYVFSKRSNFISRLPPKKRANLNSYLEYLGETWGGKQNGFGLAKCCQNVKKEAFPESCTSVYFEYQPELKEDDSLTQSLPQNVTESIVINAVDTVPESIQQLMVDITSKHKKIPPVKQMQLLTRLRLAKNFPHFHQRLKCVMARLQAVSILVYSIAPPEVVDPLIYDGFVEELVEVLESKGNEFMDIKAAVLRTLTAIIHLERDPRLNSIIEATGAATFYGFLPTLVRECVSTFTSSQSGEAGSSGTTIPLSFSTALFSFLYHLATYETSGDALVSSGIMESLLQVLEWKAFQPMNITLVTRAVRVIDLITGLDMSSFHSLGGWDKMLARLEIEVQQCHRDAPFILSQYVKSCKPKRDETSGESSSSSASVGGETPMEMSTNEHDATLVGVSSESADGAQLMEVCPPGEGRKITGTCMPERAALIKSILNFLKKAIPEPTFAENIRNFVDSSLPASLKHIVSNAEYYGSSIYLPATEVTTVFIFHEPSQLSSLQDNGLPGVVLNSIISKHIPVTREVLASLPNVLSALCLNTRGLQVFMDAEPFDHLFSVLVSPDYLPAMRKKKGTDTIGDTASNLGVAMDELMRHQPTLRLNVITALIRLLKKLVEMSDALYNDETPDKQGGGEGESSSNQLPNEDKDKVPVAAAAPEDNISSESDNDEEDDEDGDGGKGDEKVGVATQGSTSGVAGSNKSSPPLPEYVVNVVHFLDAILSNNSTDDHMKEFIAQDGLKPLLQLLSLPIDSLDGPSSGALSSIYIACRSILHIAHPPELLVESLTQLSEILNDLSPFLNSPENATNSVLLEEIGPLVNMSQAIKSPKATPILHKLVAANEFIQMFVNLSRASQVTYNVESRALSVKHWASPLGISVLQQLSRLYRALVWEGFILLAVAADEEQNNAAKTDSKTSISVPVSDHQSSTSQGTPGLSSVEQVSGDGAAMETMDTSAAATVGSQTPPTLCSQEPSTSEGEEVVSKLSVTGSSNQHQPMILVESLKQLTPLLTVTSRVGRSLAELMSLLVRLSTSPLHRSHRRGAGHSLGMTMYQPPSNEAITVCKEVTNLLVDSLKWEVPMPQACSSAMQPPIRDWLFAGMTFKMYAVDFCELLLFDEQKQSYHMMQHTFDEKTALDAFINTFHTAMKIVSANEEVGSVYGSCVDFLEAWLNLAEKLVNAPAILDSSHALPVPPPSQNEGRRLLFNTLFNPLGFVIRAQKAILPCLQELWYSTQLSRLTPKVVELLIGAICHFYSSEKIISEKLKEFFAKEDPTLVALNAAMGAPSASSSSASVSGGPSGNVLSPSAPQIPRVDPLYLQQLIDMGFTRNHAEEALMACGNDLTSAMEWILSHPPSTAAPIEGNDNLSEEQQIMQAIALSLEQTRAAEEEEAKKKREEAKKKEEEEKERERERKRQKDKEALQPLDSAILDDFSDKLLPGSIELVTSINGSVHRVCDLILSLAKRSGQEWSIKSLRKIMSLVVTCLQEVLMQIESGSYRIPENIDPVACQLHLLTLLMENMPVASAWSLCDEALLTTSVKLLHLAQSKVMSSSSLATSAGASSSSEGVSVTPKWLAPLLVMLDSWEKTVMYAKWYNPPRPESHLVIWQWFENTRWISYAHDVCELIENAYQQGDASVSVRANRSRYEASRSVNVIQFDNMIQVNTETSTQRPVIRMEVCRSSHKNRPLPPPPKKPEPSIMSEEQANTTIKCCTQLLSLPLDPDTLHANLRLCLRLTRQQQLAVVFLKEGGPQALLSLTHKSAFKGFTSLAALLFRHCLEDDQLMKQTVENVMRSAISNPPINVKEIRPQGNGSRELYYVLRRTSSCACRDVDLFSSTFFRLFHLTSALPKSETYIVTQRVPPSILKSIAQPKVDIQPLSSVQTDLINLLIDHLCAEAFIEESTTKTTTCDKSEGGGSSDVAKFDDIMEVPRRFFDSPRRGRERNGSYRRQVAQNLDDDDLVSEDMTMDADDSHVSRQASRSGVPVTGSSSPDEGESSNGTNKGEVETESEKLTEKALLSKAAVLRLLAELVESYPSCAKLIAESSRRIKIDGQPAKEMSVLAFIFDHLLPASFNQTGRVPPIAKVAKTFIQCLASVNLSPDAISVLVTEFKMAFARALSLPESQVKHNRVRALTSLLSQISDYIMASRGPVNPSHFARLLIRKGFISDLARALHSLNLNSSMLPGTVNGILKPLEVLTRIVNQVASTTQRRAEAESRSSTTVTLGLSRPTTGSRQATAMLERIDGAGQLTAGTASEDTPHTERPVVVQSTTSSTGSGATARPSVTVGVISGASNVATAVAGGGGEQQEEMMTTAQEHDESNILEATHESLIPLEEEQQNSDELEDTQGILEEVVSLAREIGRNQRLRDPASASEVVEELVTEILEDVAEDMDTVGELLEAHSPSISPAGDGIVDESIDESDVDVSEADSEEEEILEDDRCNSAGEEVEDDEYDESQLEGSRDDFLDREGSATMEDIGSDLSDADSTTQDEDDDDDDDTEVEGTGESGEEEEQDVESVPSTDEGEDEDDQNAISGDDALLLDGEIPVPTSEGGVAGEGGGAGEPPYAMLDEEEEEEEEGEEMEEEDELDLEYDFDEEDEDSVDFPSWIAPYDPMVDLHTYGGLSSLFSRAYHTRPTQHTATDLEQNASSAHLLPVHHPLLDRTVENAQQQQASRSTTGSAGIQIGNVPPTGSDSHHQESAMQQLLTNISAATGTNEVLGFGVGSSGNRMTRPAASGSQSTIVDDNLESTNIPTALSRWEEESLALDGHVPHLISRALRSEVCSTLTEMFEKENATPVEATKPPDTSTANTTQTTSEEQSTSSTSIPVAGVAGTTTTTTTVSQQTGETSRNVPVAPHPSDQVTPSSRSPRGASSTVDQLRSSLRQVADALAQTVAAVRSTREQLLEVHSNMNEEGEEGTHTEEVQQPQVQVGDGEQNSLVQGPPAEEDVPTAMESTDSVVPETPSLSSAADNTQHSTQQLTSDSPLSVPVQDTTGTTTSSAVHPTFDGSQESAAATLASTDPHDPLYTFLSAVAGAPAPPLTDAPAPPLTDTPSTSQSQAPPTVSSPRLPVFTQFQQLTSTATRISQSHSDSTVSHSETQASQTQTAIPVSVIQDSRSSTTTTSAAAEEQATTASGESPPGDQLAQEDRERDEMISDACAEVTRDMYDLASQVTSFFSRHPQYQNDDTTEATHSLLGAANMADNLAQELARAVNQITPNPTATSAPQTSSTPPSTTTATALPSMLTTQSQQQRQSLQSPSPSDTLAPLLLSSLQMASGNGAESASVTGEPGPTVRGDEQAVGVAGGSRPDTESGVEFQPPQLDLTEAGGIAQMELSTDTHTPTTNQDNILASIIHDHHSLQSTSSETRETSQTSSASLTSATGTSTAALSSTMLTPTTGENTQEVGATQSSSEQGQSQAQAANIDPTFLAALPESMRREVVAQHEREQFTSSISPEFLAALPPNIQEELIQQERIERARTQSQQQAQQAQALPSGLPSSMDNASFFSNLPPDLRRTILADMDDSLISHLPDDIATEARQIRQDRETRRRHLLEQRHAFLERMMEEAQIRAESARASGGLPPQPWPTSARYAVVNLNPQMVDHLGYHPGHRSIATQHLSKLSAEQNSKQMLDQEALTCLLVLLFLDQNKLHINRLHRIIKNLSQHPPTRSWILSSLLAIIQETSETPLPPRISATCPMPPSLTPQRVTQEGTSSAACTSTPNVQIVPPHHFSTPHWLDIGISAALGSHAKVFQFKHTGKAGTSTKICIHPLAGATVCNSVLDILVVLARQFQFSFLPTLLMPKDKSSVKKNSDEVTDIVSNFWQILFKLDGAASRKGKSSLKGFQYSDNKSGVLEMELFSSSIIGQLMALFQHDIIKDSLSLTDKLMRVLSVASGAIPKSGLTKQLPADKGEESTTSLASKLSTDTADKEEEVSLVSLSLLKVVIAVLTSGRCSEDGLDDATTLLTNLSRCSVATREAILLILLDGVRTIGQTLCSQISVLLEDLRMNMESLKSRRRSKNVTSESNERRSEDFAQQRGGLEGASLLAGVVLPSINQEQQHTDHSNDLHLPSMLPLHCKGSQQSFFLRMLKVVCQLRESAQAALTAQSKLKAATSDQVVPMLGLNSEQPMEQTTPRTPPAGTSSNVQSQTENLSQGGGSESQSSSQQPEGASSAQTTQDSDPHRAKFMLQPLSLQLELEELWSMLSECLDALADTQDPHAVLVLQPTVEAFFLVHADHSEEGKHSKKRSSTAIQGGRGGRLSSFHTISDTESNPTSPAPAAFDPFSPMPGTPGPNDVDVDPYAHLPPDTAKFLKFAENHRTVLNQILRQSTVPLSEGPFSVLVHHTRVLDFDIKRRYFRHELEQRDEGLRRDDIVLHLRRDHVFEDSFRELYRRSPDELKGNLYIQFEGEEGQDVGGLLREWYLIIAREMFNPNYALFQLTPGDKVTYIPNPSSHVNPNHLNYFKFTGRVIAKAIYDNKLLDCYFTRSFYKHILGKAVHYTDMEAEDYAFYQGMVYLLEHDLNEIGMDLVFSVEVEVFGKTEMRDLKTNGSNIPVTESNKREYAQLACQMKMTGSIRSQIKSFLDGFYEIIPKDLISIFNEQELELLISGLPTIDIDDLKANSEYHKYTEGSLQIQWFWRALRSFDQADRARFIQFVTGTSKVPLQGFAALEGMNGIQKFQIHRDDRSTDRLPCAHTCFNQLDLPPYETYDKLRHMLLTACRECPEGFGFA